MDLKDLCEPHHLLLIIVGMLLIILVVATGGNLRDIAKWFGLFKERGQVNIEIGETKMSKETEDFQGNPTRCLGHESLLTRAKRNEEEIANLWKSHSEIKKTMGDGFALLN